LRIVGGSSSVELTVKISRLLNIPVVKTKTKRFPDGEIYFRFDEDVSGEDILIVQSLYPPQDAHAMELFFMLHTAKDLGAKSVKVFIPYLAYSRQDERYLSGECLSSAVIAKMIETLGADVLYTVDIHDEGVLEMYKIPAYNLTASGELAKYFAAKGLRDPLVISPDDEEIAIERARNAANAISADYDFLKKRRDWYTGEIVTYAKHMDAQGRDVIIIDDIISTGKTSANAVRILKKQGAQRVFLGVSHALLLGDSLKLLEKSGVEEIVGTDSVANDYAKVSVAPILVKALRG
jgi:ribose-phosphate pyrophosphokinase